MDVLTRPLDDVMKADMKGLRRLVRHLTQEAPASGRCRHLSPVEQADRLLTRLAGWLLDDEQKQMLIDHPWQTFFLQAAACVCDIGLLDGGGPAVDSQLAIRSHNWIQQNWQALGIEDKARADIMALICRQMAGLPASHSATPDSGPVPFAGDVVHTDWIAACIRLSKALELKSPATFPAIRARLAGGAPDATALIDAFDVEDIGPHPYFPATIQAKIRCRDPELHRALKHHECAVQEQLDTINQHIRPRFLFSDVIYEIEPEGYQPADLKFTVDTSAALQLFMGNRLYSDRRVFLRELIQNAVDACSVRKLGDRDYSPAIDIAFNEDISRITVRDNGIGMDRQWLEKYFLSIGISFYRSDEIRTVNRDPHIDIGFISQFGIGFLSSFLVAEKIVIKTRKDASAGLKITITSLTDYFDVRALDDDMPAGTQVTLHLKPSRINYCRSMEFKGYLKTNIRFLQIPVTFTDEKGQESTLGNEPLTYAGHQTSAGDFVAPVPFADAEGYVYLGAKIHDAHIFALESASGGVSIFQDGIFVTQDDSLLPEGARQNVVGRINLKGRDKCELSMDRNRIFWQGDAKRGVRQKIRLALADVANRVITAMEEQGAPEPTRKSLINHLAIFFDFSEVDDAVYERLCIALQRVVDKRFKDFVRIHFAHTRSAAGVPDADGYGEQWQRRILVSFSRKN